MYMLYIIYASALLNGYRSVQTVKTLRLSIALLTQTCVSNTILIITEEGGGEALNDAQIWTFLVSMEYDRRLISNVLVEMRETNLYQYAKNA